MADLYYTPVHYGIHDLTATGNTGSFGLRVYYPSDEESVDNAAIRPDDYPLIVFSHGDRISERDLCPPDRTEDYKQWGAVLHLLARCGFVVAVPAVHDVVSSSETAVARVEDTVRWMRGQWVGNATLHYLPVFTDAISTLRGGPASAQGEGGDLPGATVYPFQPIRPGFPGFPRPPIFLGPPTPLALVGHSWGARACARAAVGGQVVATALAAVAGTWDENAAIDALVSANLPTLLMAGTGDFLNFSTLLALWPSLSRPKHQAALQGLEHWDWFGPMGGIQPCNPATNRTVCPAGWQIASELLLGFMTKYVRGHWWRPPYLLGSPGQRPPLLPWFEGPVGCALKVRWEDLTYTGSLGNPGEVTSGVWDEASPW